MAESIDRSNIANRKSKRLGNGGSWAAFENFSKVQPETPLPNLFVTLAKPVRTRLRYFSLVSMVIQTFNYVVNPPDRTTAAAFPRYSNGEVLADSASLQWPGLFVRRSRFPRAVDRFLVPSTPEPLMSCVLAGSAEFRERDLGQAWVRRQLKRGDIFITRSKVPYELVGGRRPGKSSTTSLSTLPWIGFLRPWKRCIPARLARWT